MTARFVLSLLAFAGPLAPAAGPQTKIATAAARYFPKLNWRSESVLSGDFSCRGRREWAIPGSDSTYIVVAVFLNGTSKKPEVLGLDTRAGDWAPALAKLFLRDLDDDPRVTGDSLPGFRRSKTCKGLRMDTGATDPANIYWDHDSQRFTYWSN